MRTTIFGLSIMSLLAPAAAECLAQYPNPYGGGYPGAYGGGYPGAYGGGFGGNPGGYGGAYGGGLYRGAGSPVSPYLNLPFGGGPAANYYNLVRPGLYGQGRLGFGGPMPGASFSQRALFPTLQFIDEEELPGQRRLPKIKEDDPDEAIRVQLPPTGHAAGFTNSMGYFGPLMAAQGGIGSAGRTAAKSAATQGQQRR